MPWSRLSRQNQPHSPHQTRLWSSTARCLVCEPVSWGGRFDDLAGAADFCINKCLEAKDLVTAIGLLEAARALRQTYGGSTELTSTIAVGIVNLIGHTRAHMQLRAWLSDLRGLDSNFPQLAEIQSFGMANAILGAAENGMPDVADDIYRELCQIVGALGSPRPPQLIRAFNNRIAVLRRYGQLDRALDELHSDVGRTFMPDSEKFEDYRQRYERHAKGCRARAVKAHRAIDGTFLSGRV